MRERTVVVLALGAGAAVGVGVTILYYKLTSNVGQQLAVLIKAVNALRDEVDTIKQNLNIGKKSRSQTFYSAPVTSEDDDDEVYEEAYEGDYETYRKVTQGLSNGNVNVVDRKTEFYNRIDKLLDGNDVDKDDAYNLLQDKTPVYGTDPDFLWRLAKSTYFMANIEGGRGNAQTKKTLIYRAKDTAYSALQMEETNSNIHKWCAITLGSIGEYEGMQVKIKNGHTFKEHIQRAVELNPEDPSLHYLLGRWCYGVYMLTWIERNVAATLFATPPTSTVEEALKYFLQAETLGSGKWKENLLFIAKCYIEKREYTTAVSYLEKSCRLPTISQDDRESQVEIDNLLGKYRR